MRCVPTKCIAELFSITDVHRVLLLLLSGWLDPAASATSAIAPIEGALDSFNLTELDADVLARLMDSGYDSDNVLNPDTIFAEDPRKEYNAPADHTYNMSALGAGTDAEAVTSGIFDVYGIRLRF